MDVIRSKKAPRKSGATEDWVYEAEMKDIVEDVSDMPCSGPVLERHAPSTAGRSQGSWRPIVRRQYVLLWCHLLLTNYVVLGVPEVKEDSVSKILERRGIKYSHRNDDILVPNTIEEEQMNKARIVRGLEFARARSALTRLK